MKCSTLVFFLTTILISCNTASEKENNQIIEVYKVHKAPNIDGKGSENFWNLYSWHPIDQNWIGNTYSNDDFYGRYKLCWNNNELLILVEIKDDVLYSPYKDPFKLWWNNDSLQIFIDEDNSGGLHQYNNNAFAYYLQLNGNTIDINQDRKPKLYNNHVIHKCITKNNLSTWEISIKLYKGDFDSTKNSKSEKLVKNKKIGFSIAYCDNDGSTERENLIGSVFIPKEEKNQCWINADIFGTLILKE